MEDLPMTFSTMRPGPAVSAASDVPSASAALLGRLLDPLAAEPDLVAAVTGLGGPHRALKGLLDLGLEAQDRGDFRTVPRVVAAADRVLRLARGLA
jgi:hypothetical protein